VQMAALLEFAQGLDRLIRGLEQYTIAMMCGEADPLDCHRGLLLTPALKRRGVLPLHLRKDGSVETTAEFEARLLEESRVGEGLLDGLFADQLTAEDHAAILEEAYRVMGRKKAFRLKAGASAQDEGD